MTHAQSLHHVEKRVGGWYDTGLTDRGKQQALQAALRLRELVGDREVAIFSSDLKRASETAAIIAKAFDLQVELMSDLREISYGSAEGKPESWLRERQIPAPEENRLDHRGGIGDGETKRECVIRIYRAMNHILATPGEAKIIVTHGFAQTLGVAAWIKMPTEAVGYVSFASSSAGITHLREDDYWRNRAVLSVNGTRHLGVNG